MSQAYEFHFQEGFSGQTVTIAVAGIEIARVEAKTRYQTGLARIEKLELVSGQEVTLGLKALNLSESFILDSQSTYVIINLEDDKLVVRFENASPGYL